MIFDREPFVFVEPSERLPGAGFILSTSYPFYIGRVIKLPPEELSLHKDAINCEGYSIIIVPAGSLMKGTEDVRIVTVKMANYYLKTKIQKHWQRYKRYEIT